MRPIIIGTRGSSLAMCQAQIVETRLEERCPGRAFEVKVIRSLADKHPEQPLTSMGSEGVFVKELEQALMDHRIDFAVHSMKDLPLETPTELCVAAVLEREEPRDALVSRSGEGFMELSAQARIGTSSLRRQSQLQHRRRNIQVLEIRGNVDTRLRKLAEGQYDAIVVAACGLIRLGLEERITELLSLEVMLPEPGQGCLALEARTDDGETLELLGALDDPAARSCVDAERAFLRALGGGCRVPIAAYAARTDDTLELEGAVIKSDGTARVRGKIVGSSIEPVAVGERLADRLAGQGARELLMDHKDG